MGDILSSSLYRNYDQKSLLGSLGIQWHITTDCDQKCKHCYMFESDSYQFEKRNTLNLQACFLFVDQYCKILNRLDITGSLHISGGDPILRSDFWDILDYINQKKNIKITILGNPYHIDDRTAKKLKIYNVVSYQISLDGLESTHDYFRKKGSFKDSLRALETLNRHGISTKVMFTLSKQNKNELIDLYKFISSLDYIDTFGFDRMVPEGVGKKLDKEGRLTPEEHKELLYKMYNSEIELNSHIFSPRKDQMWKPLFYEMGLLKPLPKPNDTIWSGCGVGGHILTVLSDGTILSCRRINEKIGRFPQDNLWDVFINSPILEKYRDLTYYEECKNCDLGPFCRGCPAIKKGYYGDPFKPDPHCWLAKNESGCSK